MIKIKDKAKVTFRIEYDENGVANVRTKARTKDICAILSCLIAHKMLTLRELRKILKKQMKIQEIMRKSLQENTK